MAASFSMTGMTRLNSSASLNRFRAGPRGFTADVQNLRALLDQFQRVRDGGIRKRGIFRHQKKNPA